MRLIQHRNEQSIAEEWMEDRRMRIGLAFVTFAFGWASTALAFGTPLPESFIHQSDADAARSGHYDKVCRALDEIVQGTHVISSLPTDQCYKMDPPERMKGIWIDAFEGSAFYPGRTTRPPAEPSFGPPGHFDQLAFERYRRKQIWLDVSHAQMSRSYKLRRDGNAILIEFVGRKTSYIGSYAHLGMFGNEVIVDQVISAKRLD